MGFSTETILKINTSNILIKHMRHFLRSVGVCEDQFFSPDTLLPLDLPLMTLDSPLQDSQSTIVHASIPS